MDEIAVGKAASFPDPGRKVFKIGEGEIGVFCINGKFLAYENVCPHIGGPVCQGKMIQRVTEAIAQDRTSLGLQFAPHLNVVCPWHGYEFDILSGRHQGNPDLRLRPVPVSVIDGEVFVRPGDGMRRRIARARSQA